MSGKLDWRKCAVVSHPHLADRIAEDTIRNIYPITLERDDKGENVVNDYFFKNYKKNPPQKKKSKSKTKKQTLSKSFRPPRRNSGWRCAICSFETKKHTSFISHTKKEHGLLPCPWCMSVCNIFRINDDILLCDYCSSYILDSNTKYANIVYAGNNDKKNSTTNSVKQQGR
jgi:hypothetical protein